MNNLNKLVHTYLFDPPTNVVAAGPYCPVLLCSLGVFTTLPPSTHPRILHSGIFLWSGSHSLFISFNWSNIIGDMLAISGEGVIFGPRAVEFEALGDEVGTRPLTLKL